MPPSLTSALRRASSGPMPDRRLSSMCNWRWLSISCASSRSRRSLPNIPANRNNQPRSVLIGTPAETSSSRLLVAQRHHRIHTHCATRRDVASRERNECEQDCDTRECRGVRRFHLEKQTGHKASQRKRSCNPGGDAEERDSRSISHNEPQHVALLRTQCCPYADLMRSLVHGISHRAERSEEPEKQHVEAFLRKRHSDELVH